MAVVTTDVGTKKVSAPLALANRYSVHHIKKIHLRLHNRIFYR